MEDANAAVKVASSLWEQLTNAPSHLLVILVLMFLGVLIKRSPIPNWTIPWTLILVGVVVYPLLASPTNVDPSFRSPEFVLRIYGGMLGIGTIIAHGILRKIPWFERIEMAFVNAFREEQDKEPLQTKEKDTK